MFIQLLLLIYSIVSGKCLAGTVPDAGKTRSSAATKQVHQLVGETRK